MMEDLDQRMKSSWRTTDGAFPLFLTMILMKWLSLSPWPLRPPLLVPQEATTHMKIKVLESFGRVSSLFSDINTNPYITSDQTTKLEFTYSCLFFSTDGVTYEVEDPQESYDDIDASPEITQTKAEVHDSPQPTPESSAVAPHQLKQEGDYLVPGQDGWATTGFIKSWHKIQSGSVDHRKTQFPISLKKMFKKTY